MEIEKAKSMKPYADVRQLNSTTDLQMTNDSTETDSKKSCTLKLRGELTYSPEYRSEYKGHTSIQRSQSMPRVSHINFHGKFQGLPEYQDSFKPYNHFTKSAPIKNKDHLKVESTTTNTAIITPISTSSEYTDQFKELNIQNFDRSKFAKQMDNISLKNNLTIGHYNQTVHPEYSDKFKDPKITKLPERAKPRSTMLSMNGDMEYKPEYR